MKKVVHLISKLTSLPLLWLKSYCLLGVESYYFDQKQLTDCYRRDYFIFCDYSHFGFRALETATLKILRSSEPYSKIGAAYKLVKNSSLDDKRILRENVD